jgi:A/G-specific adenine glycosylase
MGSPATHNWNAQSLRAQLLAWYDANRRDLPWRQTADPYSIWVSEIMLQQTRVPAVMERYTAFLERFPTVADLARASEADVLALWSGLGYYRRARMLHHAAQFVAANLDGTLPAFSAELRKLTGIGVYTAAAIASIAHGERIAVVDGNVERVVCRLAGLDASATSAASLRREIDALANTLVHPQRPGDFNQAMMELGATVCLPRNPLCLVCPLRDCCRARQEGTAAQLPVKLRKQAPVEIEAVLLVARQRGRVLLRRRADSARRMAGFWELPAIEDLPGARPGRHLGSFRHTITYHHYTFTVRSATARASGPEFRWFEASELGDIPLSTTARKALKLVSWL